MKNLIKRLILRYRVFDLLELFVKGSRVFVKGRGVSDTFIIGGAEIHSHLNALAQHVPA